MHGEGVNFDPGFVFSSALLNRKKKKKKKKKLSSFFFVNCLNINCASFDVKKKMTG